MDPEDDIQEESLQIENSTRSTRRDETHLTFVSRRLLSRSDANLLLHTFHASQRYRAPQYIQPERVWAIIRHAKGR